MFYLLKTFYDVDPNGGAPNEPQPIDNTVKAEPIKGHVLTDEEIKSKSDNIKDDVDENKENFITELLKKYQLNKIDELDGLVDKGHKFDELNQANSELTKTNEDLKAKLSDLEASLLLSQSNIRTDRVDDVKALFKGKGINLDAKTLSEALKTHPEWLNVPSNIGGEKHKDTVDEETQIAHLFGLDKFAE